MAKPHALRRRLVRRLLEIGIVVQPESFLPAAGYWRSSPFVDCYRWEAVGVIYGETMQRCVGSYDTMTICAKNGFIELDEIDLKGISLEVHAKAWRHRERTR